MSRASSGESWEETRRAVVAALDSGRLTVREAAEELGVTPSTIGGWIAAERLRRARARRSDATSFVRVDVPRSHGADVAVVVLRGGRRLRVPEGFSAEELARLVRTLESC
jgi:transposase-like protein